MPPASPPRRTLRAILDAAGRTPADVAARIGIDVARALSAAAGEEPAGEGIAPAALDASRIEVGARGEIALAGVALRGRDAADDVRALGAVLHECLAGEPPGDPPRALDVPGVPAALAAVVDRAAGAAAPAPDSPAALATAIVEAVATPATSSDVAAYAEAVLPPPDEEAPARAAPSLDAGQTFPVPVPPRPRSPTPFVIVALVALAIGFAIGFAAQRARQPPPAPSAPTAPARP